MCGTPSGGAVDGVVMGGVAKKVFFREVFLDGCSCYGAGSPEKRSPPRELSLYRVVLRYVVSMWSTRWLKFVFFAKSACFLKAEKSCKWVVRGLWSESTGENWRR